MIIDKEGIIKIENLEIIITPIFTVDDMKNALTLHSDDIRFRGSNSGYDRYLIKRILIDDTFWSGLFIFYNSKIAYIGIHHYRITSSPPWETEASDKKMYDKLLLEQHGAIKITYIWGTITSSIDTKIRGGSIIITYNNFPIKPRDAH